MIFPLEKDDEGTQSTLKKGPQGVRDRIAETRRSIYRYTHFINQINHCRNYPVFNRFQKVMVLQNLPKRMSHKPYQ